MDTGSIVTAGTMALDTPLPTWLAEVRSLLARDMRPELEQGGWSDDNLRRYYDEGLSPASAAAELQFRELVRS